MKYIEVEYDELKSMIDIYCELCEKTTKSGCWELCKTKKMKNKYLKEKENDTTTNKN